MRTKWPQLVGLLLLCVYAVAIVHQLLPHDADHDHGDSCSLCLLLVSAAVIMTGAATLVRQQSLARTSAAHTPPCSRTPWSPFSLRGPPCFLH